jgi:hypothetical protein
MSTVETFSVTIPEEMLRPRPRTKWERECQAFDRMLPDLLKTLRGKFVAIHEGEVVDIDTDDIALIRRVHAKIGYVPILVERVDDPPPPLVRIPHYRVFQPRGGE